MLPFLLAEIECDKKKSYSVKKIAFDIRSSPCTFIEHQRQDTQNCCKTNTAKQNCSLLLELTTYRGAVLEQRAVYKTWFFRRPGAERAGSSKNQFFPTLLAKEITKFFTVTKVYITTSAHP